MNGSRTISISVKVTPTNIAEINRYVNEHIMPCDITEVTISPIELEANQIWLDGMGREIKIVASTVDCITTHHKTWRGILLPIDDNIIIRNYSYDDNGICFENDGTHTQLNRLNLIQLLSSIEPKPGEYWVDGNNDVWFLRDRGGASAYTLSANGTRSWTKFGKYLPGNNHDSRDLIKRVYFTANPDECKETNTNV